LAVVGAKLHRLNQQNNVEDSQQGVGHTRGQQTEPELQATEVDQSDDQQGAGHTGHTGGQLTEPQAMEVDQSDGQQGMGATEDSEQETEPQAIEANQHETQVSDVSALSIYL
jgi:hypothetical protein